MFLKSTTYLALSTFINSAIPTQALLDNLPVVSLCQFKITLVGDQPTMPAVEKDFFEDTLETVFDRLCDAPEIRKSVTLVEDHTLIANKTNEVGFTLFHFQFRIESSAPISCVDFMDGASRVEKELLDHLHRGPLDFFDDVEDCFVESDESFDSSSVRTLSSNVEEVDIILMGISNTLSLELESAVATSFETAYNSIYDEGQHLTFVEVSDQLVHGSNRRMKKLRAVPGKRTLSEYNGDYLVLDAFVEREFARALTLTSDEELLLHRWFELFFCDLMRSILGMDLIDCLVSEPR